MLSKKIFFLQFYLVRRTPKIISSIKKFAGHSLKNYLDFQSIDEYLSKSQSIVTSKYSNDFDKASKYQIVRPT